MQCASMFRAYTGRWISHQTRFVLGVLGVLTRTKMRCLHQIDVRTKERSHQPQKWCESGAKVVRKWCSHVSWRSPVYINRDPCCRVLNSLRALLTQSLVPLLRSRWGCSTSTMLGFASFSMLELRRGPAAPLYLPHSAACIRTAHLRRLASVAAWVSAPRHPPWCSVMVVPGATRAWMWPSADRTHATLSQCRSPVTTTDRCVGAALAMLCVWSMQ